MNKNFLTIVAFAAALVACNKTEAPVAQTGAPVQFRASVANEYVMKSTTIDNPIDDGTFVGVYAGVPISVNNKKYAKTTSEMTLTPESGNTISWLVGQNGTQDFYAYYPYSSSATSSAIPVEVKTDQTTLANLNLSDFLWGIDDNRAAGTESSITLNHKLTKVIINIDNNLAQDVTGVAISGLKNSASASPATGELSSLSGSGDIAAYRYVAASAGNDGQYIAIVLPEESVTPSIKVTVANSLEYTFTLSAAYTFVSGTTATANLVLDPGASEAGSAVVFGFTLGGWTSGSAIGIPSGTPTPTKPANKWSVIGTINGTDWNQDFYLTQTATGSEAWEGTWEGDINYAANQEFKLRYNNAWEKQAGMNPKWLYCNIGENDLGLWNAGSINVVLANSNDKDAIVTGSYHIKFIYDGYKLTVTKND